MLNVINIEGMEKVYISGKISGIEEEAEQRFKDAEVYLSEYLNYEVVNPMTINHEHDKSWQSYMKADIREMMSCDAIFMLTNWTDSKGAEIERRIALDLGIKIIYEK
jgi:hypothetical protein